MIGVPDLVQGETQGIVAGDVVGDGGLVRPGAGQVNRPRHGAGPGDAVRVVVRDLCRGLGQGQALGQALRRPGHRGDAHGAAVAQAVIGLGFGAGEPALEPGAVAPAGVLGPEVTHLRNDVGFEFVQVIDAF